MAQEQAQQEGPVVAERQTVAPVAEVQDFSPPQSSTWPDIANQCWSGDIKGCATSLGQKLSESFGFGSTEATQQLQREGKLPELTLIGGSETAARGDGAVRGDGAEALPKALQGDNKKRTETVMDAKGRSSRATESSKRIDRRRRLRFHRAE